MTNDKSSEGMSVSTEDDSSVVCAVPLVAVSCLQVTDPVVNV